MADIFICYLFFNHPNGSSHVRLLCRFQRKKYHRVSPHILHILFASQYDFHSIKVMAVINLISTIVQFLLKKCFDHVKGQRLAKSSGPGKKAHIALPVNKFFYHQSLIDIIVILVYNLFVKFNANRKIPFSHNIPP